MAGDTAALGKMIVELLLKDDQFQDALGQAQSSMQSQGAALASGAKAASSAITTAFKAATASIAAFGAASTAVGAGFEQQMAMVGALQGLTQTDKAFQDLQAQARLLGSTTEFTATQAASALEDLARAGATVEESIQSSNAAMTLAGTSAAGLSDSTQLLVSTQRQFGLEASESERITNVFSLAMRKSLLDFTSVREAMKFAGTAGASFGMTLEETTASIAAFRDLGLEGSLAGTNFRMAMIAAAQGTDKQRAVLEKYGLTLADINPEQNTFIDIVEQMAESGVTASDAIALFGSRAGSNVAQLAAETAKGNVNMRAFTETLGTASEAGNTAADMYETIGQTIAFQSKLVVSAMQDLMIEVFDTFAGPLRTLIETIPGVLTTITAAVQAQAPALRASFGTALGGIATFLQDNAGALADAFVNTMKVIADLGPVLQHLAQLLIFAARNADILLTALAFGTAVVAAFKLVAAVTAVSVALGGASTAVTVLGTTLTVTTGGLFAAVAAVGALVVGLGALITNLVGARNETERLNDAQAQLGAEQDAAAAAAEAEIAPMLERQQALALQRLRTEELTDAETARLQRVLNLTAAEAARLEMEGKLVRTGGQLHEVGELMNAMGDDAVAFLDAEAAALDNTVQATDSKIAALEKLHASASAANVSAFRSADLAKAAALLGRDEIASVEELQVRLGELGATREATAKRAHALRSQVAQGAQQAIKDTVTAEFDAQRAINQARGTGADAAVDQQAKANTRIMDLRRKLQADLAKVRDDESDQIKAALDKRLADIGKVFDAEITDAKTSKDRREQLVAERDKAIAAAEQIARQERANADAKAAEERAEQEQRLAEQVQQITRGTLGKVARMELEAQDQLTQLAEDGADARQLAAAKGALDAKIGQARVQEERRVQDLLLSLEGKSLSRREQLARDQADVMAELAHASTDEQVQALEALNKAYRQDTVKAVGEALKAVGQFAAGAVAAAKEAAGAVAGLVSDMTGGFSVDLLGNVQEALDLQEEQVKAGADAQQAIADAQAALEAAKAEGNEEAAAKAAEDLAEAEAALQAADAALAGGTAGFAVQVVQELVDSAVIFADALARSVGPMLTALAEGIPTVLDAVIAAIPTVVQALVDGIPPLVTAVVAKLPELFNALAVGLVDLVVMVLGMLPALITQIMTEVLPAFIATIVEQVPRLLQALVDALPVILQAIIESLPVLLEAIIGAIPPLVQAVVEAVPQLISALLFAIPQLVAAVLSQVPLLIQTVIGMLPDVLQGFIDQLPTLIEAVITLLPMIVLAIIEMLPEIAFALVESIIMELIPALPGIVVELFAAIIAGMGKALKSIAEGIWDAIKDFFNIFKRKDDKDDKKGAFSGIDYVPATMRMTLHQGEAVVSADRNAERIGGGPAAAGAVQAGHAAGAGGGGGGPVDIAVMAEGRLLDAVQVQAMKRGGAVGVQNEIRRASGVRIGLDTGRFNPWSRQS